MDLVYVSFSLGSIRRVTYHKFFLEMVSIVIVLAWVNIPASKLITIDAIVLLLPDESTPVVLGQESSVRFLPRLVLNIGSSSVL